MGDIPLKRESRPKARTPRGQRGAPTGGVDPRASPVPDTAPVRGPPPGYVHVNHANAPEVHALLLAQNRDWQIRNHRLLREIAYYLRCLAEGRKPQDAEALDEINRAPEAV